MDVIAYSNELKYILDRFENIPRVKDITENYAMSWHGDIAKFIVANLK